MKQMQLLLPEHQKLEELKAKRRDIQNRIKEGLENSKAYTDAKEELDRAKNKLNAIKVGIMTEYFREEDDLDATKKEIKEQQALLTDIAITNLVKGQDNIIESDEETLEPVYKVTFKRKE